MTIKDRKEYCMKEDLHLFTFIENELFSWELQIAIDCATEGRIHLMMFLHPVVITTKTKLAYIEFANEANFIFGICNGEILGK